MAIKKLPPKPIFPKEDEKIIARDKDGNVDTLKTIINIADKILSPPKPTIKPLGRPPLEGPFDNDELPIIKNSDKSDK